MVQTATLRRGVLLGLTVAALAAVGWLGWHWMDGLTAVRVEIDGAVHANPDSLASLAGVTAGERLLDVNPMLVADRVRRHPWVERAEVQRLPTGTVRVAVVERTPAALVIDRQGHLSHYLDAQGYGLPLSPGVVYDVPLLRGMRSAYHPVTPVHDSLVLDLLSALHTAEPATDRLISEVVVRGGEVWVWTSPDPPRSAVPVRLGRDDFPEKLRRLDAFWQQAVHNRPERTFHQIDLRFAGHVVTQETAGD